MKDRESRKSWEYSREDFKEREKRLFEEKKEKVAKERKKQYEIMKAKKKEASKVQSERRKEELARERDLKEVARHKELWSTLVTADKLQGPSRKLEEPEEV